MVNRIVLAIDPGTNESAFAAWDGERIHCAGKLPNHVMLATLATRACDAPLMRDVYVIEQVRSYGMPVGAEVFQTVFWAGRFAQTIEHWGQPWHLVPRLDVKLHICRDSRARDANIRQALIDRLGEPGTKKNPGVTYGLKADLWQALALAVTWHDKNVHAEAA